MVDRSGGRRVGLGYASVSRGKMVTSTAAMQKKVKDATPDRHWGLGIAKVLNLDYEEFQVTLKMLVGVSDDNIRLPIPMTFPGAGARHFLGAMPQIGDLCVVGWAPQESSQADGTRIPVILTWLLPGVWPGREWAMAAGFPPDELDQGLEKYQHLVEGVHDRIRHKLRHVQPGNIVASSSQGADMVLDEGVLLANRRGNEIRLRDQDQAFIVRSLQQFHAMAGARVYSGMVQRDAQLLSPAMVSDGKEWDGVKQTELEDPVNDTQLPDNTREPENFLTPARPLIRQSQGEGKLGSAPMVLEKHVDPYEFLRRGGFIDTSGLVLNDKHVPNALYGGKPVFRVAAQSTENAALYPDQRTLTEYRIEMAHTSDGRLPVTEQTDMFDAERLPTNDSDTGSKQRLDPNSPFIESVLGSVVGNDPYSEQGRAKYGLPLVPVIFDGDNPNPRLDAARLVEVEEKGDSPTRLDEHAATLFRLTPPLATGEAPDTWWSVNKRGQLKVSIAGPLAGNSVEAVLLGGLKLSIGGSFQLMLDGPIQFGSKQGNTEVSSSTGGVRIFGGGSLRGPSTQGERASGREGGDSNDPSVLIEGQKNVAVRAVQKAEITAAVAEINASQTSLIGHQSVEISSAQKVSLVTNEMVFSCATRQSRTFAGPKDLSPTNAPLRETSFSPALPGLVVDKVTFEKGDRKEEFRLGNHETVIQVGDMTYQSNTGKFTAQGGQSKLVLSSNGINGKATSGSVTLKATAGAAVFEGQTAVTVQSDGIIDLVSNQMISLQAPVVGTELGSILSSGTLDPLTGLPFNTWGLGAPNHTVEASF